MGRRRLWFRRRRREGGFTLVEMLVGLTLFALLSVLLFGGFRFGLRAWEMGGARAEQSGEVQLVQEMLRRQVGAAQPAQVLGAGRPAADRPTFVGTADSLTFVAILSVQSSAAGLYRFEVGSPAETGAGRLVLNWSVFASDHPAETARTEALLEDIDGIRFAYFGRSDANEPPRWHESWSEAAGLPQLVRLSVTFPPGDDRAWPDLIVAPRLRGAGQ